MTTDPCPGRLISSVSTLRCVVELEEADQDWIRKQKLLDLLWQAKLDAETDRDDDQYFVGGFQEFHSKTPSFHKAKRDRDWRVR